MSTAVFHGLQPHHDGSMLDLPAGGARLGDRIGTRVRLAEDAGITAVWLRTEIDGEPRYDQLKADSTAVTGARWFAGEVELANPRVGYRFLLEATDGSTAWLTARGVHAHDVNDRSDFVAAAGRTAPAWLDGQLLYQVFLDRFAAAGPGVPPPSWAVPAGWDDPVEHDGDRAPHQLYGGNLDGVTSRLDHLEQLGVGIVYLTPFWPARSSHRYDARTFDHVDPLLGGDRALRRLVAAAHQRGIRVIGDLTLNHSGDHHEWFRRAVADPGSPEAGFYLFDEYPDRYDCWMGVRSLPRFDHRNAHLRQLLYEGPGSVVGRWVAGEDELDGWRIDVANMVGRHGDSDLNRTVARTVRDTLAGTGRDPLLLAEHAHDAARDLAGDGWHGTMAYAWMARPLLSWLAPAQGGLEFLGDPLPLRRTSGHHFVDSVRELTAGLPWPARLASASLLGSHDTARAADLTGDGLEVGVTALFTLPGLPMVLAGDEIGARGRHADAARTPFPWDTDRWNHRTLALYRQLSQLRRATPALRHGGFRWLVSHPDTVVYARETGRQQVVVQLTRASHRPVVVPPGVLDGRWLEPVADAPRLQVDATGTRLPGDGPAAHVWIAEV